MNCLLGNADEGRVSILTLLDLSAAFDTLHQSIPLARLHDMFGVYGNGFRMGFVVFIRQSPVCQRQWLGLFTEEASLRGSVLGPILLTLYTRPLSDVISLSAVITNLLTTLNFTNHQLHLTFIH